MLLVYSVDTRAKAYIPQIRHRTQSRLPPLVHKMAAKRYFKMLSLIRRVNRFQFWCKAALCLFFFWICLFLHWLVEGVTLPLLLCCWDRFLHTPHTTQKPRTLNAAEVFHFVPVFLYKYFFLRTVSLKSKGFLTLTKAKIAAFGFGSEHADWANRFLSIGLGWNVSSWRDSKSTTFPQPFLRDRGFNSEIY